MLVSAFDELVLWDPGGVYVARGSSVEEAQRERVYMKTYVVLEYPRSCILSERSRAKTI